MPLGRWPGVRNGMRVKKKMCDWRLRSFFRTHRPRRHSRSVLRVPSDSEAVARERAARIQPLQRQWRVYSFVERTTPFSSPRSREFFSLLSVSSSSFLHFLSCIVSRLLRAFVPSPLLAKFEFSPGSPTTFFLTGPCEN